MTSTTSSDQKSQPPPKTESPSGEYNGLHKAAIIVLSQYGSCVLQLSETFTKIYSNFLNFEKSSKTNKQTGVRKT